MIKSNKQLILKIFTVIFIISMLNIIGYSRIVHNGSGQGYEDPDGEDKSISNVNLINTYIEVGAGYFLKSYSDILILLNRIELQDIQGIDFQELQKVVSSALENILNSKDEYNNLIQIAEITPYNQTVISKLKSFDYNAFMKENSLNSVIFKEVAYYMINGDITGIYKRSYEELCAIVEILISIKNDLYINKMPELSIVWKLNENFSEALIYGEYVARVFFAIL